jgi:hypothetical protein
VLQRIKDGFQSIVEVELPPIRRERFHLVRVPPNVRGVALSPRQATERGKLIRAGDLMCRIGDPRSLEAYAALPDHDLGTFAPNARAWALVHGHVGAVVATRVERVAAEPLESLPPALSRKAANGPLETVAGAAGETPAVAADLPLKKAAADVAELKAINECLWTIEDDIRDCDARGDFGPAFVALARSVYRENDRRAHAKRRINEALGSTLVEEKSYRDFSQSCSASPTLAPAMNFHFADALHGLGQSSTRLRFATKNSAAAIGHRNVAGTVEPTAEARAVDKYRSTPCLLRTVSGHRRAFSISASSAPAV